MHNRHCRCETQRLLPGPAQCCLRLLQRLRPLTHSKQAARHAAEPQPERKPDVTPGWCARARTASKPVAAGAGGAAAWRGPPAAGQCTTPRCAAAALPPAPKTTAAGAFQAPSALARRRPPAGQTGKMHAHATNMCVQPLQLGRHPQHAQHACRSSNHPHAAPRPQHCRPATCADMPCVQITRTPHTRAHNTTHRHCAAAAAAAGRTRVNARMVATNV